MKKIMGLCKDKKRWQKTNIVKENIEEIAGFLDDKNLKEKLWGGYKKGKIKKPDERNKCSYYPNKNRKNRNGESVNDNNVETERRMCRCMYYCNHEDEKVRNKCEKCKYKFKYYINEKQKNIKIINYELPTKYVVKNIGNVDICLQYDGVNYAVEVKPYPNKGRSHEETLARMLVEILTYSLDENIKNYKLGIMFPKEGEQDKEFKKYREMPAMKKIMRKITFFRYKRDENKNGYIFTIEKLFNR